MEKVREIFSLLDSAIEATEAETRISEINKQMQTIKNIEMAKVQENKIEKPSRDARSE